MFMRRLLTALCVLLFSLQATCAAIQTVSGRSVDITNQIQSVDITNGSETDQAPHLHPTPNALASGSLRRSDQSGANDQIHERHETIDWRQDQALKLEAEREAGFHASSQADE